MWNYKGNWKNVKCVVLLENNLSYLHRLTKSINVYLYTTKSHPEMSQREIKQLLRLKKRLSFICVLCTFICFSYDFVLFSFSIVVYLVLSVLGVTWLIFWWQKGLSSQFVTRAFTMGLSASSGHMPLCSVKHQNWVSQGLFFPQYCFLSVFINQNRCFMSPFSLCACLFICFVLFYLFFCSLCFASLFLSFVD